MRRKKLIIATVLVAAFATAIAMCPPFCMPGPVYWVVYGWRYPQTRVTPIGVLTDRGPVVGIWRYSVDLGEVALGNGLSKSLVVVDLPPEVMEIGFVVDLPPTVLVPDPPAWAHNLVVTLELKDRLGVLVAEDRRSLAAWRWAGSVGSGRVFVIAPIAIRDGSTHTSLRIQMESPGATSFPAQFLIAGGGWAMQGR